jgi:hypothetical protein
MISPRQDTRAERLLITRQKKGCAGWNFERAIRRARRWRSYAGTIDDQQFLPQAEQLLRSFEAIDRPAVNYMENRELVDEPFRRSKGARFLVLPGGK